MNAFFLKLLNCSARRGPAAFGGNGVKTRVRAVLNDQKPAFRIVLAAALAVLVQALCFASEPYSLASDASPFTLEDNTGSGSVSYPYLVRTDSAVWYLSGPDMELLGEDAYLDGFEKLLGDAEQDFADARTALSGLIDAEIPPVNIYTDFCGKAEEAELLGAYYSPFNRTIRLFRGWDVAAASLLHEYVHYLTFSCCSQPVSEGFYAEAVAEYIANFACRNACARSAYRNVSEDEKALARLRRIWDEAENSVDPVRMYIGMAEFMRSEHSVGMLYPTIYGTPMNRSERQLRDPMYTTASYYEAGCMMCYLAERFGMEKIASVWSHSPSEMEQDFGKGYRELYWDWAGWNSEKRVALDIAPPETGF